MTSPTPSVSRLHLVLAFCAQEGWFDSLAIPPSPLSIPHVCRNPGNLRWAPSRFPSTGLLIKRQVKFWDEVTSTDQGYVVFKDVNAGFGACENDLNAKIIHGYSLNDAIAVYAPARDGNDPVAYASHVGDRLHWTAAQRNSPLKSVLLLAEPRVDGPWVTSLPAGPPRPDWDHLDNWIAASGIRRTTSYV